MECDITPCLVRLGTPPLGCAAEPNLDTIHLQSLTICVCMQCGCSHGAHEEMPPKLVKMYDDGSVLLQQCRISTDMHATCQSNEHAGLLQLASHRGAGCTSQISRICMPSPNAIIYQYTLLCILDDQRRVVM